MVPCRGAVAAALPEWYPPGKAGGLLSINLGSLQTTPTSCIHKQWKASGMSMQQGKKRE